MKTQNYLKMKRDEWICNAFNISRHYAFRCYDIKRRTKTIKNKKGK